MTGAFPPSTPLATLYENVSKRGTKYFMGRMGLARVVLLPGEPTAEGVATWRLMVQEAPPKTNGEPRKPPSRRLPAAKPPMRREDLPNDNVTDLWPEASR